MNKQFVLTLNLGSFEFSANDHGELDCYAIGKKLRIVAAHVESYEKIGSNKTLYGIITDDNAATIGEYEVTPTTFLKMNKEK